MYNDYTAQERRYLDKNGNPVIVAIEYDTSPEKPRETYDCYSVCFDGTNEDELFKHAEYFYALTPYEEA